MPQMNKGGKFVFGKSVVGEDGAIQIPAQAVEEYQIAIEEKVYLFTGSKSTGGFCVTRKGLLQPSLLGHILTENTGLQQYQLPPGRFIRYKGRHYCWLPISGTGRIVLNGECMGFLQLKPGMQLLSIRSSNIAFTMGARGPLLKRAEAYTGTIPTV